MPDSKREQNVKYRNNRNARMAKDPVYAAKIRAQRCAKQNAAHTRKREGAADRPRPERCEVCAGEPGGRGKMHWDHNHKTGAFRGWLCHRCNTALGLLSDDVALLSKLSEYLLKHMG